MTTDDVPEFDRPPLVATTAHTAYRWENPEPEVDGIRSVELEVTEGLAISQDRRTITGTTLSAANLRVVIYDGDGVPRPLRVPLRPGTAAALRDVADAYDALHHMHVELAARRATLGAPTTADEPSVVIVEDEGASLTGPEGVAARLREAVAARLDGAPPTWDTERGGWISGASGSGKGTGDAVRPAGCICSFHCGSCAHHGTPHRHDSAPLRCKLHPDAPFVGPEPTGG